MDADKDLRLWRLLTRVGIVLVWVGLGWGLFGPEPRNLGWAVGFGGLILGLVSLRVRSNLLGKYGE